MNLYYHNKFKHALLKGDVDFDLTIPVKIIAWINVYSSYPNIDTDYFFNQLNASNFIEAEPFIVNITRDDTVDKTIVSFPVVTFVNNTGSSKEIKYFWLFNNKQSPNDFAIAYLQPSSNIPLANGQSLTLLNLRLTVA